MQTSVIGFPRIGAYRELKFATEKYFKKEIDSSELSQTAETLRKTHWNMGDGSPDLYQTTYNTVHTPKHKESQERVIPKNSLNIKDRKSVV